MKVIDRILGMIGGPDESTRIRVRSIRFRRLLEDVRSILELSADAAEKRDKEFIFDGHYVTSLVDRVIDASRRLVHDTCILAPDSARMMYRLFDECRRFGQDSLLSEARWEALRSSHDHGDSPEPEYVMLDRTLEWMEGVAGGEAPSVDSLVDLALERALEADSLEPRSYDIGMYLEARSHRLDLLPLFQGAVRCDEGSVSEMEVGCRPLGHMLMGSSGAGSGRRWSAVVSPEHIDARSVDGGPPAHITACISGYMDSDFAFVAVVGGSRVEAALPSFTTRNVGRWSLAWRYGAQAAEMEESLVRLGSFVFGRGGS